MKKHDPPTAQCLFPGRCLAEGDHKLAECHTVEMIENLTKVSPLPPPGERFPVAVTLEGDLVWEVLDPRFPALTVIAGMCLTNTIRELAIGRGATPGKRIRARIRIELADGPVSDGT